MNKAKKPNEPDLKAIRNAVADYMYSEGCSCCQNREAHEINRERLAKLLKVPKKDDWYNFGPYRTKKPNTGDKPR